MRSNARDRARNFKHQLFLLKKIARRTRIDSQDAVQDFAFRLASRVKPYEYMPGMYRRSFVNLDVAAKSSDSVPQVIYCFWTGDNDLSPNRARNFNQLQRVNPSIPVKLVLSSKVSDFVVDGYPLHPMYEQLSLVHRSDYLRAYFLLHHGGGYADIKETPGPWRPHFERLREAPDLWAIGYPERSSRWAANAPRNLGRDLRHYYTLALGTSALIMRPGTPLAAEWMAEVNRRMDYFGDMLAKHPGGVRGENPLYPVSWNNLLAQAFHPLCLKHHGRIIYEPSMAPSIREYR